MAAFECSVTLTQRLLSLLDPIVNTNKNCALSPGRIAHFGGG
jgi:hypothetical protein